MIINSASIGTLNQGVKTIFNQAVSNAKSNLDLVAMTVPSSTETEIYAWLGAFPSMREWIGDRVVKNLASHDFSLKNKTWESTISIPRSKVEDDTYGIYRPIISEMGRKAALHPDEIVMRLFASGFTAPCYDGQNFFDTDHPVGDASVSNTGGGAGTAWYLLDTSRAVKPFIFQSRLPLELTAKDRPDDDNVFDRDEYRYGTRRRDNAGYGLWQLAYGSKQTLDATNYAAARAAMMAYKDEAGDPLDVAPTLLVVPPSLESAGRALVVAETLPEGGANPWYNTAQLLVSPWV